MLEGSRSVHRKLVLGLWSCNCNRSLPFVFFDFLGDCNLVDSLKHFALGLERQWMTMWEAWKMWVIGTHHGAPALTFPSRHIFRTGKGAYLDASYKYSSKTNNDSNPDDSNPDVYDSSKDLYDSSQALHNTSTTFSCSPIKWIYTDSVLWWTFPPLEKSTAVL